MNKSIFGSALVASLLVGQFAVAAAKVDPALRELALSQDTSNKKRVIVVLKAPYQSRALPQRYNSKAVIRYLRNQANLNFKRVRESLDSNSSAQGEVQIERMYWVNSSFSATVTRKGLSILTRAPGVEKVYANGKIGRDPEKKGRLRASRTEDGVPYDIVDIKLDALLRDEPNANGKDIILGHVDTGVEGNHPALRGKILHFFDGETGEPGEPKDSAKHGTHTAGTMIGDARNDAPMGMAPKAKLVSAGALSDYDAMLKGMEFMLDPDQDPNTTTDLPRAINNSWNARGAPDMELFYRAIGAWEAVGILPVFSAGNSGPGDATITPPHEHPGVLAVGATAEDGKITSFSSRGPATFRGKRTQKPDLTAPGNNIFSSVPGGRYESMSGTSMAAPHVAGAAALLIQAAPKITPEQIRQVFLTSAVPLDEKGNPSAPGVWNKVYGLGKMDIQKAVLLAKGLARGRTRLSGDLQLFSTPDDIAVNSILGSEEEPEVDPLAYPAELEGNEWLTPEELGL